MNVELWERDNYYAMTTKKDPYDYEVIQADEYEGDEDVSDYSVLVLNGDGKITNAFTTYDLETFVDEYTRTEMRRLKGQGRLPEVLEFD